MSAADICPQCGQKWSEPACGPTHAQKAFALDVHPRTPTALLRVVRRKLEPGRKYAGRTAVRRIEVVVGGEVVGELNGVTSYAMQMPVDGVVTVDFSVATFDEVFEDDAPPKPTSIAPIVVCPRCGKPIEAGQDTAKVNGITWHAGCAEDHEQSEAESTA